jgi:serine/threonine protein kinase
VTERRTLPVARQRSGKSQSFVAEAPLDVALEVMDASSRSQAPESSSGAGALAASARGVDAAGASADEATDAAAQDAFLRALARDASHPSRALGLLGLTPEVQARAAELAASFERSADLEDAFVGADAVIERAMAEVRVAASRAIDRAIPARIGAYRIDRVLSVAPNSAVLIAEQESPIQRTVALKLLFEDGRDERLAARVELERQILATLEHPNIARIYDFGIDHADRPYLVMELVRDGQVTDWARRHAATLRARVELFLQVTAAVRFAHARGVLHLDLKPANILVQELPGGGAQAVVKVIDFGVARAFGGTLAERTQLTDLPRALGTLLWMAPETLEPAGKAPDVRADVFGLGLVLFELLAGRAPRVAGADALESLRRVLEEPIPDPRTVAPQLPEDLAAIVLRATAQDAESRYQSVDAMADDLERWLRGEELLARPWRPAERLLRNLRRSRRALAVGGVLTIAVVTVGVLAIRDARARSAAVADARAQVDLRLGEANQLREVPGREAEQAIALYRALDAIEVVEGLLPADSLALSQRAQVFEDLTVAALLRGEAKRPEVGEFARQAVEVRRELVRRAPGEAEPLERLSIALSHLLDTRSPAASPEEFAVLESEQLAIDEKLHAEFPEVRRYADNLAWTYTRVGGRAYSRGSEEEAIPHLLRVRALGDWLLERYPEVPVTHYTAMAGALYSAFARLFEGDLAALEADLELSLVRGERALELDPGNRRIGAMYTHAASLAADLALESGRPDKALAIVTRAEAVAGPLVRTEGTITLFGKPLLDVLALKVESELALGNLDGARRAMEEAEIYRERERIALVADRRMDAVRAQQLVLRARVAALGNDHAAARRDVEGALELVRRGAASESPDDLVRYGTSKPLVGLVRQLRDRAGDPSTAPQTASADDALAEQVEAALEGILTEILQAVEPPDAALSAAIRIADLRDDRVLLERLLSRKRRPSASMFWRDLGVVTIEGRVRAPRGD